MGEVSGEPGGHGAQKTPRRFPAWARWSLLAWWAVIAYLALNWLDTFVGGWWPALHDALAALPASVAGWPLLAKIGLAVGAALILGGFIWLTVYAFQKKREFAREDAQAKRAEKVGIVQAGTRASFEQLGKQVEALGKRLEEATPAEAAGVVAPTGLPRPASLVGREDELKQLMDGLRAGESVGVFALEGMGGVGKTAIAAEAVARLAEDRAAFPGGAVWVVCNGLVGDEGLAELWTQTARLLRLEQVASQADPQARRVGLAAALAQWPRLLLALDNVEPGLDARAALDTLSVPHHTAVVLTARHEVAPEKLTAMTVRPLKEGAAETLFSQRLRQADAARPTPEEQGLLGKLVETLGGLPLAIELTAAYVGKQHSDLALMLQVVEEAPLNVPALRERQRGLIACFDRSWEALTARQRRLFAGLSLLAGASFPRAAALSLGLATVAKAQTDAEGDLATLVSYALAEPLAGERLRLHPLLREYAGEKLAKLKKDERERLGDMMVAFWRWYAEQFPGYEGMDALEAEAAGLMGALTWAHEQARHQELLALARAILRAWDVRGRRDEELQIYGWSEQAAQELGDLGEQRWAAHQLGVTQSQTGRLEEARAGLEEALLLAQQLGDPAGQRDEIHALAVLNAQTGRLEEARAGLEEALLLARQLGDPAGQRDEIHSLAVLNAQTGRLEEARAGYEEALLLARQLRDPDAEAVELCNFGLFLCQHGEQERGRKLIHESLAIGERLSNIYHVGKCHQFLAWLDRDEGTIDAAIAHFREALRCFEQVQSPDAEEVRADLRRLEAGEEIGPSAESEVLRVIRALLNTRSWEETRAVLEREQALLLTDSVIGNLAVAVEQARQSADPEAQKRADYAEAHLTLLRRAREVGIPAAWAEFEAARQAASEQDDAAPDAE